MLMEGHTDFVNLVVAFSTDGMHIVSGSFDQRAPVWNNETGESMLQMEGHTLCINAVAFSTDGMRIASGASDKTVGV